MTAVARYYAERWPRSRFWAIYAPAGTLVALVVYRKGAAELLRLLNHAAASGTST